MISKILLIAAIVIGCGSSDLFAQRGYTALTAEYLASTSDLVVRARIRDLEIKDYVAQNDEDKRSAHNFKSVSLFLTVTFCFKGVTDESIQVRFDHLGSDPKKLTELKEARTELYWFLKYQEVGNNGIRSLSPHDQDQLWKSVVEPPNLNAPHAPVMLLNVDLEALNTKDKIESTIIEYVRAFEEAPRSEAVRLPIAREIAGRTGMAQAVNWVLLPSNYRKVRIHNSK